MNSNKIKKVYSIVPIFKKKNFATLPKGMKPLAYRSVFCLKNEFGEPARFQCFNWMGKIAKSFFLESK